MVTGEVERVKETEQERPPASSLRRSDSETRTRRDLEQTTPITFVAECDEPLCEHRTKQRRIVLRELNQKMTVLRDGVDEVLHGDAHPVRRNVRDGVRTDDDVELLVR